MRITGISRTFAKRVESDLELFTRMVDFKKMEHQPLTLTADLCFEKEKDGALVMTEQNGGLVVVGFVKGINDSFSIKKEALKNGVFQGLIEARRGKVVPAEKSLLGALRVF